MKKVLSILMFLGLFFQVECVFGMSGEKTLRNIFEDNQVPEVKKMFESCFADEATVACDISGKIADIIGVEKLKEKFFTQIVKNVADALTRSGGWLGITYGTKLKITTLTMFNSLFEKFKQSKSNDFNLIKDLRMQADIKIGTKWSGNNKLEYENDIKLTQSFEKWLEYFKYYANKVHEHNAYNTTDIKKAFCFLSPTFVAKEFEKEWQASIKIQSVFRGKLTRDKQLAPLKKELADLKQSLSTLKVKLGALDNKLVALKSKITTSVKK